MSGGEIAAIITAIGSLILGMVGILISALTSHNAARKDELESLRATIESLQKENSRLQARLNQMDEEIAERESRITALESELRQAVESRERRIQELQAEVTELKDKVSVLEGKRRKRPTQ